MPPPLVCSATRCVILIRHAVLRPSGGLRPREGGRLHGRVAVCGPASVRALLRLLGARVCPQRSGFPDRQHLRLPRPSHRGEHRLLLRPGGDRHDAEGSQGRQDRLCRGRSCEPPRGQQGEARCMARLCSPCQGPPPSHLEPPPPPHRCPPALLVWLLMPDSSWVSIFLFCRTSRLRSTSGRPTSCRQLSAATLSAPPLTATCGVRAECAS